jgi:hypothetical protein
MKMGRKDLLCNSLEALDVCLLCSRDWCQALHITTVLYLYAFGYVTTNPFYEGYGFHWRTCSEKYY